MFTVPYYSSKNLPRSKIIEGGKTRSVVVLFQDSKKTGVSIRITTTCEVERGKAVQLETGERCLLADMEPLSCHPTTSVSHLLAVQQNPSIKMLDTCVHAFHKPVGTYLFSGV